MTDHSESMEEQLRYLRKEMDDLKRTHAAVTAQRESLNLSEDALREELEELSSVKTAAYQAIADLQSKMQELERYEKEERARLRELSERQDEP